MKLFLLITAFFLLFEENEITIEANPGGIIHQTSDTSAILYNLKCNDTTVPCHFKMYLESGKYMYADFWLNDTTNFLVTNNEEIFITFTNNGQFKIIK